MQTDGFELFLDSPFKFFFDRCSKVGATLISVLC